MMSPQTKNLSTKSFYHGEVHNLMVPAAAAGGIYMFILEHAMAGKLNAIPPLLQLGLILLLLGCGFCLEAIAFALYSVSLLRFCYWPKLGSLLGLGFFGGILWLLELQGLQDNPPQIPPRIYLALFFLIFLPVANYLLRVEEQDLLLVLPAEEDTIPRVARSFRRARLLGLVSGGIVFIVSRVL